MRLVPAVGGFEADAGAEFEAWGEADGVFEVAGAHEVSASRVRSWCRNNGEGLDGARRKVVSVAKEAWPYWSCARLSLDWRRWSQPPASIW